MELIGWSIALILLCFTLALAEVFIPSGGILGVLAVGSFVAAVLLAFYHSVTVGLVVLIVSAGAVPLVLTLAFRVWPHTPLGRRILLPTLSPDDVRPDSLLLRSLRELVGKTGVAKSPMFPSGAVLIERKTIDAVSEGMSISKGQAVRVISVHGNRVVVRPVEDDALPRQESDLLSQPIESLGIDPIDDPLA